MKKGFTLIEALVTIAIIGVLAGILLPVLVSSKRSAISTDDLSKMRQIGQAAAMYENQFGVFPLSDTQIVAAGMLPKYMCASNRDSSVDGIANELAKFQSSRIASAEGLPPVEYKNSFVGMAEFGLGHNIFNSYVLTGPAAGWLIDAADSERTPWPTPNQWKGTYKRLCVDGSVVVRQYRDFECYNEGKPEKCRMSVLLFVDPNPTFTELVRSDEQQPSSPRG
jgi:prepilin-type N-terminal cleavage/methylation domain-containing protein